MDCIRLLNKHDLPALTLFWAFSGETADAADVYPIGTSYVVEREGDILYAVAVHQIKGLPIAYVECVIRNPAMPPDWPALQALQAHLEVESKAAGYTRLVGIPRTEGLCKHYEKLGYNRVGSVIYAVKEL
jgi:hypothetical protein